MRTCSAGCATSVRTDTRATTTSGSCATYRQAATTYPNRRTVWVPVSHNLIVGMVWILNMLREILQGHRKIFGKYVFLPPLLRLSCSATVLIPVM